MHLGPWALNLVVGWSKTPVLHGTVDRRPVAGGVAICRLSAVAEMTTAREVIMRKILAILSGSGLLVALFSSSCIVKEKVDEAGGEAASGGSRPFVNLLGGSTANASTTSGTTGGAIGPEPCPDLLQQLKTDPKLVCSQQKVEASFTKINLLIVLDKSGSMGAVPEGYMQTKWAGAIDALKKSLDPTSTLISYGIMLYPSVAPDAAASCDVGVGQDAVNVAIGSAAETVPQINALMAAASPGGGTPAAAALGAALDYYTKGDGVALDGAKYVLFVTDGGPNCNSAVSCSVESCTAFMDKSPQMASCWNGGVANCCDRVNQVSGAFDPHTLCLDDVAVTARLEALRGAQINTFVIGIPGSEVYGQYLDSFAVSGGVPVADQPRKYYEVTGESGLREAFDAITTRLVGSCIIQLATPPWDTNAINVAVDCSVLPQKTGVQVNWDYYAVNNTIEIQGGMCEKIKAVGVNRIDIVNGCPRVIIE